MSMTIRVEDYTTESLPLLDPVKAFGAPSGQIFRVYQDGVPADTYFIGTGGSDRPICVWFDDETGEFRLSSDSKKDLLAFSSSVKIRKCGPLSFFKVELNIEDYE